MKQFDQPECLRLEVPDAIVPIDNETQSRELTGAVRDDLTLKLFTQTLELKALQPREGGANAQVKLNPGGNGIDLALVHVDRRVGGSDNMADEVSIPLSKGEQALTLFQCC